MPDNPYYTVAQFREYFPQFATTATDDQVQEEINKARSLFNYTLWDNLYYKGIGNVVAHELTMNLAILAGTFNPMSDAKTMSQVGQVRKQLDATIVKKMMDEMYARTYYGQKYLYYRRLVVAGMAVAV